MLYEMGIPVCEIECDFSLDVQQKVPLSFDRDKVSVSYLKDLYGHVLNVVHQDIEKENSSNQWVRMGTASDHINKEAVDNIVKKRYGSKVVIANPMDKCSIDDAISKNYNVVYGNEMSKEEWNNIRRHESMESSSKLFGSTVTNEYEVVKPTIIQTKISYFIKKIAREYLSINVGIRFITSKKIHHMAEYGNELLTFNLSMVPNEYWLLKNNMIQQELLELIIHELAHEKGLHYEESYHQCITYLAVSLVYKMKSDRNWFNLK